MEYANGGGLCPGRIGRFRPVPPLAVITAESALSDIGRPFPRLRPCKRAVWRGGDLPRFLQGPTEIADDPRHLTGPSFRTVRAANDDFIALFYSPRRRAIGFVETVREIGIHRRN